MSAIDDVGVALDDAAMPPTCPAESPQNCRATRVVPAGPFIMGDPDPPVDPVYPSAAPAFHATQSSDRWVSTFESTNGCFRECLRQGACLPRDVRPDYTVWDDPSSGLVWEQHEAADRAANFSFPGAARYCAWLGGQVVSEAEWMKMARGEHGRVFPWADDPGDPFEPGYRWDGPGIAEVVGANWREEFARQVADVGTNDTDVGPYGHRDVAGLSAEWTRDTKLPYDPNNMVDPLLDGSPECGDRCWRIVVANWFTAEPDPDIRFRKAGSYDDFNEPGPYYHGATGYSVRCSFPAEPPPLCRSEF